jgi:hypothetical protein
MTPDPDDELLDQLLRETFNDFELPPASRVWTGIEGHLAAMPPGTRPLPLRWLLPVVALVGVGAGWLLPRPANRDSTPKTVVRSPAAGLVVPPRRETLVNSAPVGGKAMEASIAKVRESTQGTVGRHGRAVVPAPRQRVLPAAASAVVLPAAAISAARPDSVPLLVLPANADVVVPGYTVATPLPDSVSVPENGAFASSAVADATLLAYAGEERNIAVTQPTFVHKEGSRERRLGYRVPMHRTAEKGRGFRRHMAFLTRRLQHIFGPRRSRTNSQSNF